MLRGIEELYRWAMVCGMVALLGPATAPAGELEWVAAAVFGDLSATHAFDVNADAAVSAADLSARLRVGEPRSAGCGRPVPSQGRLTTAIDGTRREYVLRLPSGDDNASPRPVVFAFHGFTQTAAVEEGFADVTANWPEAIAVYPEGLPRTFSTFPGVVGQGWQVAAGEFGDRDLRLFDGLVEQLNRDSCINPERIYATGFSNGAIFSYALACARAGIVAAIGPRAGFVFGTSCPDSAPVPVVISHGSADSLVPFFFGTAARDFWIVRDDCDGAAVGYAGYCEIRERCAQGTRVGFCQWDGGHAPDPLFPPVLFRFFREHAR